MYTNIPIEGFAVRVQEMMDAADQIIDDARVLGLEENIDSTVDTIISVPNQNEGSNAILGNMCVTDATTEKSDPQTVNMLIGTIGIPPFFVHSTDTDLTSPDYTFVVDADLTPDQNVDLLKSSLVSMEEALPLPFAASRAMLERAVVLCDLYGKEIPSDDETIASIAASREELFANLETAQPAQWHDSYAILPQQKDPFTISLTRAVQAAERGSDIVHDFYEQMLIQITTDRGTCMLEVPQPDDPINDGLALITSNFFRLTPEEAVTMFGEIESMFLGKTERLFAPLN